MLLQRLVTRRLRPFRKYRKIKVTVQRSNDGTYKAKQVDVVLKGKDTLDGLDDGSTQQQNDSGQNYNNDNYNNNYDNDNSQVVPWGGSIY